ncbi:hypothetical protein [Frateuria defendens]|uniref:hypothetical protein n=1 Tax=Frateuria defendens TaxID=2219559 RepID=UPI00066FF2B8|nr:hypothetical protein [Frateuria defendens]
MQAQKLIALAAAGLFTLTGLVAIHSNTTVVPPREVNGTKVVDFAPVQVTPSAADLHAAGVAATGLGAAPALVHKTERGAAALIGAQLAMPYYSFGSKLVPVGKE